MLDTGHKRSNNTVKCLKLCAGAPFMRPLGPIHWLNRMRPTRGSTADSGSSSSITSAPEYAARASASRAFCPPAHARSQWPNAAACWHGYTTGHITNTIQDSQCRALKSREGAIAQPRLRLCFFKRRMNAAKCYAIFHAAPRPERASDGSAPTQGAHGTQKRSVW